MCSICHLSPHYWGLNLPRAEQIWFFLNTKTWLQRHHSSFWAEPGHRRRCLQTPEWKVRGLSSPGVGLTIRPAPDPRMDRDQQGWRRAWRSPEPPAPHEVLRHLCLKPSPSWTHSSSTSMASPPRAGSNNGKQIGELGNVSSTSSFQDTRLLMKPQLCRHHLNDRPNFKGLQTISCAAAPPPQ